MIITVHLGAKEGNGPALKRAVRAAQGTERQRSDGFQGRCSATDVTENGGISMNPLSILMFCFSGVLFLYAVLLYTTRDYKLIPRGDASKTDDKKAYARQVAEIVALVAIAPAHCGYVAMFSMGWSMVVLVVEFILAIWVGTKLMD